VGQGNARHHPALDYEVRDEMEFFNGIASPRVPKEMVSLASHILDTKAGHFDPANFKDEFESALAAPALHNQAAFDETPTYVSAYALQPPSQNPQHCSGLAHRR
jgi:non-homologous end joining protein Ku